jgi:hypothetical protein
LSSDPPDLSPLAAAELPLIVDFRPPVPSKSAVYRRFMTQLAFAVNT